MRTFLFLISYCFALSAGFSQALTISNPLDGAVFQRTGATNGNGGQATIRVQGTFNSTAYEEGDLTLEATLRRINLTDGQPTAGVAPITFEIFPNTDGLGSYAGSTTVPAGWYTLQVVSRQLLGGGRDGRPRLRVIRSAIRKVGVGEVFIIAGQSNAQGLANDGKDPSGVQHADLNIAYPLPSLVGDDGVRVQPRFVDPNEFSRRITFPFLGPLLTRLFLMRSTVSVRSVPTTEGIAPTGNSLWYWAYFGQKISRQYNVPVAMYNVAWGGTFVKAWSGSALNPSIPQLGYPGAGDYPVGAPFNILRTALNFYGATYGTRAVLWLQGETDVEALRYSWPDGRRVTSSADYAARLNEVVSTSRTRFADNVPWVIGRNSIYDEPDQLGSPNQILVQQGQEGAVNASGQVHQGPNFNTEVNQRRDDNMEPRGVYQEPTHFRRLDPPANPALEYLQSDGLAQAGNAWFTNVKNLIDQNQISSVSPQSIGTNPQLITISADGTTATAPAGYSVQWVSDDGNGFTLDDSQSVAFTRGIQVGGEGKSTPGVTNLTQNGLTSSGTYRAILTDNRGNKIITNAVQLPFQLQQDETETPTSCFEGENGNSTLVRENNAGASGGQIIGTFGDANAQVSFNVSVASAGTYTINLTYSAAGDNPLRTNVSVNGGSAQFVELPKSTGWSNFRTGSFVISLPAGASTLRFGGVANSFWMFDKFCLEGGTPPPPGCDFTPSVAANTESPGCGGSVDLTANCTGADCSGLGYSWTGGGTSQTTTRTLPNQNGTHTYTVTMSRSGCTAKTADKAFTLSGCGTTGGSALTKVRAYFRTDGCGVCQDRCNGALVQGSDNNSTWTAIATLPRPNAGWNEHTFSNTTAYAYIRYVAAGGCYGELMELEFYAGDTKLSGTAIGGGAPNINPDGSDNGWAKALDGNLGTFWHGASPGNQNWAGFQVSDTPQPPTGCSAYTNGTQVAYRTGNPGVRMVVSVQGSCRRAVWSDGSGNVHSNWLLGNNSQALPGFTLAEIDQCLVFDDESCPGGRVGAAEAEAAEGLALRIAPNPSNGRFTVHFQTKAGQRATLRIYDLAGRAVRSAQQIVGDGQVHSEAIVLPATARGTLVVEVVAGQQRASQKVVIE